MRVVPFLLHVGLDASVALLAFWISGEALEVGIAFYVWQTLFLLWLVTKTPESQDSLCAGEDWR